jgi:hypothetical protein
MLRVGLQGAQDDEVECSLRKFDTPGEVIPFYFDESL